jgi:hypothetical protein
MDARTVFITTAAILFLGIFYMAGHDFGKRSLVVDIDTYGCEKVIAKYHGISRSK